MEQLDAARDELLDEDDQLVCRVKDKVEVEKRLRHKLLPRNAWRLIPFFELFMSSPKVELARFCASTGSPHWAALHHLMEYFKLAGTPSFKITYRRSKGSSNLLSGYADADWGNSCSLRSTSGTLMLYNKAPIMWRSKMQKTTALSTAEAEYYSASAAGTEVLYLRASFYSERNYKTGPRIINGIVHRPSFVMGCYVCSVLNGRRFCSVHNGAGSRTSAEQKFNHK